MSRARPRPPAGLQPIDANNRAVHVSRCRNTDSPIRVFCRAFGIDLSLAQARFLVDDLTWAIAAESNRDG